MKHWPLVERIAGAVLLLAGSSPAAHAWDEHRLIMQSIGRTTANLNRRYLYEKIAVPSVVDEKRVIHELATELLLNEKRIPVYSETHPDQHEVVLYELFRGEMIDEPDRGMDQDLPDAADPEHIRDWMGGRTGESSQGFRHMYFGGFQLKDPIQSFQIPFRAVGEAKLRFQKLMKISDRFFLDQQRFWGTRTLLWALHYLQDLHQPFHVVQVPNLKFLPLGSLFDHFVAKATHSLTNYHYGYEAIARTYLEHYENTYFRDCFETDKPLVSDDLSEIIEKSRAEASSLAEPLYDLLGSTLKTSEIDLQKSPTTIDYWQLIKSSESESVGKLREVTCRLYQSIARYTWGHFDRSFNYIPPISTKSGR
jgi:hypothetical protein